MAKKSAAKKSAKSAEANDTIDTSVETTAKKPRAKKSASANISAFDKPEKERTIAEQMLVDQYNSRLEFHDKLH